MHSPLTLTQWQGSTTTARKHSGHRPSESSDKCYTSLESVNMRVARRWNHDESAAAGVNQANRPVDCRKVEMLASIIHGAT